MSDIAQQLEDGEIEPEEVKNIFEALREYCSSCGNKEYFCICESDSEPENN